MAVPPRLIVSQSDVVSLPNMMKEDLGDVDIINYGNPKNGFIEILDSDNEWLLVRIENKNAKKSVTKLIRMESVERISILSE